MAPLMFPPVVPDGLYRIRSYARSNPDKYLQSQSDNEIKTAPLDLNSNAQKWKIVANQDDVYSITNVATGQAMSVKEYDQDYQKKYRLYTADADTYWTLEPRGDVFIIGVVENYRCIDLAVNDWVILWERNNLPQQRWVLDNIETKENLPTPKPTPSGTVNTGAYNIKNRATDSEICIWTYYIQDNAPVLVWPATGTARNFQSRKWDITGSGTDGGLFITNSYYAAVGPRFLREGPFVNKATNVCYLTPVQGTSYYFISMDQGSSRVLQDSNPKGAINQPATMADKNGNDFTQMWQLNPAH